MKNKFRRQSKRKKLKRRKKKGSGFKRFLVVLLVLALVGAGVYYAYSQGMLDGLIAGILGPDEPVEELPESIGKTGYGSQDVIGQAGYDIDVIDEKYAENNGKFASVNVPSIAIADGVEKVDVTIIETNKPDAIKVEEGLSAASYYVGVTGLAEDNVAPIKVKIFVGEDYNSDNLAALYCGDKEVANARISNGYAVFETTELGICTIVINPAPVVEEPDPEDPDQPGDPVDPEDPVVPEVTYPKAEVTYLAEHVNVDLPWGSYGQWSPTAGLDSKLEAAFQFVAPHTSETINDCEYKDWYCDFYVKLDRDLGANQIFLGGNYGSFGWVGFHNGELELPANEEIPLLGSVTSNPWTYADVVNSVGTFICGVGDVGNALEGATFTVSLRLVNPADETDFIDCNVVTFTFGNDTTPGTFTGAVIPAAE